MPSKLLMVVLATPSFVLAADREAIGLLAKAKAEFLANREKANHWIWTSIETHFVTNKAAEVLEKLPSVTVESPIRSDGRHCNAVLSWGDGTVPYLADADADARCQVEQEAQSLFKIEALLASAEAKIQSRSKSAITISIRENKSVVDSADPITGCAASIRATVALDPATFFPKLIAGDVVGNGCDHLNSTPIDHYGDDAIKKFHSAFRKGATFRLEYELQKDKTANDDNHFWISVRRHYSLPLQSGAAAMLYWGRRVPMTSKGGGRFQVKDVQTTATQLSADVQLKFEGEVKEVKKDK